jgi:hypothetical protein
MRRSSILSRPPGEKSERFIKIATVVLGSATSRTPSASAALRLSPFFDAEEFAAQFGTEEARRDMLTGLRVAG